MNILDFDEHYRPPFSPPRIDTKKKAIEIEDNLAELNNLGHDRVSEDFEDSSHADRKPLKETDL